jgi:protein-glutamine gamma-glutamyltransferase
VAGVGWVPLDPSGAAGGSAAPGGLAEVTAQARADLPAPQELRDPPLPASEVTSHPGGWVPFSVPLVPVVVGLLAVIVVGLLGIPALKAVRAWRRRRLPGPKGVVAAWWEARDRLRAHGVPCTVGMTVRDLATAASTTDRSIVDGLIALAHHVDAAVWSGTDPGPQARTGAWEAVAAIQLGLSRRRLLSRIRASLDPTPLFAPRPRRM